MVLLGAGTDKRGKLVEWVEKASFDRLNKLFEIATGERSCQTLLFMQNLRLVSQVSQLYVPKHNPEAATQEGGGRRTLCSQGSSVLFGGVRGRRPGTPRAPQPTGGKEVRGNFAEGTW